MVVELRTLRIQSDFTADGYVAGMNKKVAADRAGAESSKAVGIAVENQKISVSSAVPLIEKLSRTYADGYGTAAKFNGELLKLARSQDTRTDLQAQGFADPRIGSVPFVRLPDDVSGLDKTRAILESSPLTDRIKELRANMQLTELGAQQLQEALKKTFNTTPYGEGSLPIVGPVPAQRPNVEMEGLPGEAKSNEATRRSYEDIIKSAQDRIAQMTLEAEVSGVTGIAAQRMRFQLDLLQESQDKGRKITPDQRREIERLGDAYEESARQAARLGLQADLQFQSQQLGRSEQDQRIADMQRGAGLPVELNSEYANSIRELDRIKQARADLGGFFNDLRSGLMDGSSIGEAFRQSFLAALGGEKYEFDFTEQGISI